MLVEILSIETGTPARLLMLKQFLIMCSGAEASILDDPRCVADRSKYAAIGATVLSTAALASLSGGYAIYTTFRNVPIAIGLGIVWALIIFNLDRYIVSTLRKQRIDPTLSKKERLAIRGRELGRALPRFLLAVFIAVVITRPIELKLFEREINAALENRKSDMLAKIEQKKRAEFPQIDELVSQNEKLRTEIAGKEKQRDDLHELAMSEALGKLGERTTGRFGKGIVYEQRYQAYLKSELELSERRKQNESKIAANEKWIASFESDRDKSTREARHQIEEMGGLLARLQIHSDLTGQKGNGSIALASWFIIGLFILLETAPIVVKLLSDRGPYDEICEAKDHEVYVSERRKISNINDDANTRVSLKRRRNAAILDAESRLRKGLIASMETLAAEELRRARSEIATTLIDNWRQAELRNFESKLHTARHTKNGNRNVEKTNKQAMEDNVEHINGPESPLGGLGEDDRVESVTL